MGSRGKGILCTDQFPARPARASAKQLEQTEALAYPPYPYEDTFLLHSYPSSNQKLFMDFDGYDWLGWTYCGPWSIDGDDTTFNETERLVIQQVWYSVAEDFLPFTIDVTTEEPPSGWLGQRAVIDRSLHYAYSWAYVGVWPNTTVYAAYIHPGDDTWLWIADSVSHEVGHTLGLHHHGIAGGVAEPRCTIDYGKS